jgi:uncharacterized protein (DUF952 family)
MEQNVYKILRKTEWATALENGVFSGAPIDIEDGFIHFSTRNQVEETAAKHFADEDNLFLLEINVDDLDKEALKWEVSRNNDLFPHLYAALELDMVSQVWQLNKQENGQHDFSVLTETDTPTI